MEELIHKQPPDWNWPEMSGKLWLMFEQQEDVWKRFLNSSRSFLRTWKRNKGVWQQ